MSGDKTLYVVDFDRTLVDTDEIMRFTEQLCSQIGIDISYIQADYKAALQEGRPYSPLEAIRKAGPDKAEQFRDKFLATSTPERFIYPDAKRLLDTLNKLKLPYMILTYATDESWQKLKLQAAGFDSTPTVITFNPLKGQDLTAWQDSDGNFQVPLAGFETVKKLVFIDDRLRALSDLPANCQGFWVQRGGNIGRESAPANVEPIQSLDQLVDRI